MRTLPPIRRDERGSMLAVGALALMVVLAMVGGGLDLGRAYLTRSRLQQACDAGVLAGRAEMGRGWQGARPVADAVFAENFPEGTYGTRNLTHSFTSQADRSVSGSASAEVPMALMRLFGFRTITVTAACGGELQMANADIMFVLDTTTSMAQINDGDSMTRIAALKQAVINFYNTLESNRSGSDAQVRYGFVPFVANVNVGGLLKPEWLADQWTYQSRRTIMKPKPAGGIDDQRIFTAADPTGTMMTGSSFSAPSSGEAEVCQPAPAGTYTESDWITDSETAYVPNPVTGEQVSTVQQHRVFNGSKWAVWNNGSGTCYYTETVYENYVTYRTVENIKWPVNDPRREPVPYWQYAPITYDVSPVKTVGPNGFLTGAGLLTVPIGHGLIRGDRVVPWRGCIEERQTVETPIDGTTGIPAGALDLDIDLVPDSRPETKWGPSLPHLVFKHIGDAADFTFFMPPRNTIYETEGDTYNIGDGALAAWIANAMTTANGYKPGGDGNSIWDKNKNGIIEPNIDDPSLDEGDSEFAFCPAPARRLAEIDDVGTLSDYMDRITQRLGRFTHHDLGMIWGARLLSPDGLFKDENRVSKNGGPITRHLILMTDGNATYEEFDLKTDAGYGLEPLDHKRQPMGSLDYSNSNDAINAGKAVVAATVAGRFQAICKAARAKFTVWVVAFGTELTDNLRNCASPDSAFQANNAAELNQRFLDIAGKIASLRITR